MQTLLELSKHSLERRGGEGEKGIVPYTCLLGDICMQEEELSVASQIQRTSERTGHIRCVFQT